MKKAATCAMQIAAYFVSNRYNSPKYLEKSLFFSKKNSTFAS